MLAKVLRNTVSASVPYSKGEIERNTSCFLKENDIINVLCIEFDSIWGGMVVRYEMLYLNDLTWTNFLPLKDVEIIETIKANKKILKNFK